MVVLFIEKFRVKLLSSKAMAKPRIEMDKAVIFMYQGIVRIWMLVGGMFSEMRNPARILPSASRLIGLIRFGLFSFIVIRGE